MIKKKLMWRIKINLPPATYCFQLYRFFCLFVFYFQEGGM